MVGKLVLIAGGSGVGKSTLAIKLVKRYPSVFSLVHLDDYYKTPVEVPKLASGTPNWDHPDALRFDTLFTQIGELLAGASISVETKSELYNPEYDPALRNKIRQVICARPIVLLEGYLALWDERIRRLSHLSIFLDMPIEQSVQRRGKNKFTAPVGYFESTLIPVHKLYVEGTKKYAQVVIDVTTAHPMEVLKQIDALIKATFPTVLQ